MARCAVAAPDAAKLPPVTTTVYTDGACLGNPGPGGWAWILADGSQWGRGSAPQTTNQRMEITAAHRAIDALPGPLVVVSDSTYVVKCFTDEWWKGWIKRGWKNSKKEPVANRDLWEPFVEAVRARGDVEFRWVKGHSGDRMNDRADELATSAAREQIADETGSDTTAVAAANASAEESLTTRANDATDLASTDVAAPETLRRHGVVVTGLRPPGLGGYVENAVHRAVRDRLREILAAKREVDPDLVVVSGLGLGSEQLGAEAAIEAEVPFVAVLPYPDPEQVWPEASQARFRALRDRAAATVLVSKRSPKTKQEAGRAVGARDDWLSRNAREAIVVWDDHDASVGRTVRNLESRLEDVWVVRP